MLTHWLVSMTLSNYDLSKLQFMSNSQPIVVWEFEMRCLSTAAQQFQDTALAGTMSAQVLFLKEPLWKKQTDKTLKTRR